MHPVEGGELRNVFHPLQENGLKSLCKLCDLETPRFLEKQAARREENTGVVSLLLL